MQANVGRADAPPPIVASILNRCVKKGQPR